MCIPPSSDEFGCLFGQYIACDGVVCEQSIYALCVLVGTDEIRYEWVHVLHHFSWLVAQNG